jgi:uncharacterized membrane protein YqhA
MPLQQWILLNIPTWVIAAVMLAVAMGTAVGGVLLVRNLVDIKKFKEHHDIAGPIFSTIGVIYAVMLAFVLVIVWHSGGQLFCRNVPRYRGIARTVQEPVHSGQRYLY